MRACVFVDAGQNFFGSVISIFTYQSLDQQPCC